MDALTVFNTSKVLLDCIYTALKDAGLELPCRVCAVPGEIVWDDCQKGQLVVSTVREFQSEVFPVEALERGVNSSCGLPYLVAEYNFSLVRCVSIPKGTATTVPCTSLEADSVRLHQDAYWMRNALTCCLLDLKRSYTTSFVLEYIIGPTVRVGPEGMCAGNETTVAVGFVNG